MIGRSAIIVAALALGPLIAAMAAPATEAELGRAVYTNCAGCHGERGQGGFAPPLAGSPTVKEDQAAIVRVVAGSVNMPPFGEQLSDVEIAAVLNHVRNSWGNKAAPIRAADVAAIERQLGGK
jgi:cytochrome c oxidase cbb3-type subunit II